MKVGDLVSHKRWGKGIVIEKCFRLRGDRYPPVVRVITKRATLRIHEQELTILSESEG